MIMLLGKLAVACLFALLAYVVLVYRPEQARRFTFWFARISQHRWRCILAIVALSLGVRLALMPWMPIPNPVPHDQESHLLIADTFAHGRVTNPTHPFWPHFESIYVFHTPSYSSPYPPGQGAALALGQVVFGHPWYGAWLSTGIMCGMVLWALYGWLPSNWALLGGIIVLLRFGIWDYWMNSYWGGSVAALGGALVFGSLVRMWNEPKPKWGALFALGWSFIWFTRIFEALILGVLLAVIVLLWTNWRRVLAPIAVVVTLAAACTFYYDWRVTGDPLEVPNRHQQKLYGVPMAFYFQKEMPGGGYRLKAIQDNYEWQKKEYDKKYHPWELVKAESYWLYRIWRFFVNLQFTPFVLLIPLIALRDKRIRLVLAIFLLALCGSFLYPILQVHYFAQYTTLWALFIAAGMRYVRKSTWGVVLMAAAIPMAGMQNWKIEDIPNLSARSTKFQVIDALERMGGKHLVFVRYGSEHHFYNEWVYNKADIDASKIVWAQEVDPDSDAAMIRYFADRKVWTIDVDAPNCWIQPYVAPPREGLDMTGITPAAPQTGTRARRSSPVAEHAAPHQRISPIRTP